MSDGYSDDPPEPIDDGLDEYLCEYVDGSMDPVTRKAFEEYLQANPHLAEHVRCLCQTREMLCKSPACAHAPLGLQERLRIRIARDLMGEGPGSELFVSRLGSFALITSAVGLMLILGAITGSGLITRSVDAVATSETTLVDEEISSAPNDTHRPIRARALPDRAATMASYGIAGPVSALPMLTSSRSMTPLAWPDSLGTGRRSGAAP